MLSDDWVSSSIVDISVDGNEFNAMAIYDKKYKKAEYNIHDLCK